MHINPSIPHFTLGPWCSNEKSLAVLDVYPTNMALAVEMDTNPLEIW